jgi:hypothetical protein
MRPDNSARSTLFSVQPYDENQREHTDEKQLLFQNHINVRGSAR